jgi:hypothetical protein
VGEGKSAEAHAIATIRWNEETFYPPSR